jgi:hypothetical protein
MCAVTSTATSGLQHAVGHEGYSGVTSAARLLDRIRLPEVCGNICFGGPKDPQLVMRPVRPCLRPLWRVARADR